MNRKIFFLSSLLIIWCAPFLLAQNSTVNQNQQIVNFNLPVIEKPVYIERYRTVYVDRPRVARKLEEPLLLLGYIWVYPEDLGNFKQPPYKIIERLNQMNSYGHSDWRIPTPDELAVLEANADKVGLGDDVYMATDHCNGVLRLVARPEDPEEKAERLGGILIGNVIWAKMDEGASCIGESGKEYFGDEARSVCPEGWRLPTKDEYQEMFRSGRKQELHFQYYYWNDEKAKYWTQTKNTFYSGYMSRTGWRYYWYCARPASNDFKEDGSDADMYAVRCVRSIE